MGRFAAGGLIVGQPVTVKIPANECVINPNRVCIRQDQAHRDAERAKGDWFTCPAHGE